MLYTLSQNFRAKNNRSNANPCELQKIQKMRCRRAALGVLAYLIELLLWGYAYAQGMMEISLPAVAFFISTGFAVQFSFLSMTLFDWNLKFKDPSMTFIQILAGLTINIPVLYFMNNEARGIFLFTFCIPFTFCALKLSYKECFVIAAYSILYYISVIGAVSIYKPEQLFLKIEMLRIVVYTCTVFWLAFFGGNISRLRYRLRKKHSENKQLLKKVEALAERDELTGLYNRRKFFESLEVERARTSRTGKTFSIGLIDLDHFKKVNDTYGHMIGDQVLRTFARLAEQESRTNDIVARYGGEEFIMLLASCDRDACSACIDRIQTALAKIHFESGSHSHFRVSFSAGVTEFQPGEALDTTIERADKFLYEAKKRGRRLIISDHDTSDFGQPSAQEQ